jgi:hypothetical protein
MLAARSPRGSIVGARQPTRQQRERSTPQCFLARFSEGTEPNHRGSLTTGAAELLASSAISSAIAGAKSENGGKRTKTDEKRLSPYRAESEEFGNVRQGSEEGRKNNARTPTLSESLFRAKSLAILPIPPRAILSPVVTRTRESIPEPHTITVRTVASTSFEWHWAEARIHPSRSPISASASRHLAFWTNCGGCRLISSIAGRGNRDLCSTVSASRCSRQTASSNLASAASR